MYHHHGSPRDRKSFPEFDNRFISVRRGVAGGSITPHPARGRTGAGLLERKYGWAAVTGRVDRQPPRYAGRLTAERFYCTMTMPARVPLGISSGRAPLPMG